MEILELFEIKERFFSVYEHLKKTGKLESLKDLGEVICTNKAGVSDLKYGRKKITIEHVVSMINSYEEINILWLLTGRGEMILNNNSLTDDNYVIEIQKKIISNLEEQLQTERKRNYDKSKLSDIVVAVIGRKSVK